MSLWIVTTRLCQLACPGCYQSVASGSVKSHLDPGNGLVRYMSDEIWEAGMRWATDWPHSKAALEATLYGGEPLLAWRQIEKHVPRWNVHFARERGRHIHWKITTNGVMLRNPEIRQFLDRYGIGVLLSLNGPPRLHDKSRPRYDGRGSWDLIDPESLARWRPDGKRFEIAWTLEPSQDFQPSDLDWMVEKGFRWINLNIDWLVTWSALDQIRLTRFMRHAGLLVNQGKLRGSNWKKKIRRSLIADEKMTQPCGTGTGMLALSPEGWLLPSQEMVFTTTAPGKADMLRDHYRVGDVTRNPVIDEIALRRVSNIYTKDLRKPFDPETGHQYNCDECIAKSDCIGGCHCRYVGQRPNDPSYRHDIPLGYCQSNVAALTGWLQAESISRNIRPSDWNPEETAKQTAEHRKDWSPSRTRLPLMGW